MLQNFYFFLNYYIIFKIIARLTIRNYEYFRLGLVAFCSALRSFRSTVSNEFLSRRIIFDNNLR